MCETTVQAPVDATREGDWRTNPARARAAGRRRWLQHPKPRWTVLGRNWRSGYGEVDIIALDPDAPVGTVSLIEVKTRLDRGGSDEVLPELAVDEERRKRYKDAAVLLSPGERLGKRRPIRRHRHHGHRRRMAHMRHIKDAYGVDLA